MGGSRGGGGSQQTTERYPDWLKPHYQEGLTETKRLYEEGDLGKVIGLSPEQQEGLGLIKGAVGGQKDTAEKSASARDILLQAARGGQAAPTSTGATDAIKAKAIRDAQISSRSGFGDPRSSRTGVAQNEFNAALAGQLAGIDYTDLARREKQALDSAGNVISSGSNIQSQYGTPGKTLTEVGSALQEQKQREADAGWQAAQRRASLVHGVPLAPNQVQQKGGK